MFEKHRIDYTLYLVTDRGMMSTRTLEEAVEQAILGGCTLVQVREKTADSLKFYEIALGVKKVTDRYQIPLIIDDRVDIALAVDAAGVHVGQSDIPAKVVRRLIGEEKILGVSASNLKEALKAKEDGADYLGIGAVFSTGTKANATSVTKEELRAMKEAVNLPVVAIGGISEETVAGLSGTQIDGISVVSAIMKANDICHAAAALKTKYLESCRAAIIK